MFTLDAPGGAGLAFGTRYTRNLVRTLARTERGGGGGGGECLAALRSASSTAQCSARGTALQRPCLACK